MRLLVVDDDPVDREAIIRALRSLEREVSISEAKDGKGALEFLATSEIDCLILDYRLPDLDGLTVLERARSSDGELTVPIIMMTGEGSERVAVEAMKRGASDYFPKAGLDPANFCRAINAAVERSRLKAELEAANEKIERLALYDTLTGLGNRNRFNDQMAYRIAAAKRKGEFFTLMFMDLNKFKQVNDRFGHLAGDGVLRAVGARLQSLSRSADLFFRLGGDEFAALVDTGEEKGGAEVLARKIVDAVTQPVDLDGHSHLVGVSIGIVFYPEHGTTAETLIHEADAAMYAAKRRGGGYVITRGTAAAGQTDGS